MLALWSGWALLTLGTLSARGARGSRLTLRALSTLRTGLAWFTALARESQRPGWALARRQGEEAEDERDPSHASTVCTRARTVKHEIGRLSIAIGS